MSDDLRSQATTLDDVVAAVPGVAAVYATQPALLHAAKETLGAILGSGPASLVLAKEAKGVVTVEANIAVAADAAAPQVASAVRDAVLAVLPELFPGTADPVITVRVTDVRP
ncbi:hypothetical protein ACL9RL_04820 [Plantibacter sp. Mn2098]|uniref:hypothetical protein n=1 Tax=Plantibacter sp. Mn2098 TaxID=3395266 RepID=UPI003BEE66C9